MRRLLLLTTIFIFTLFAFTSCIIIPSYKKFEIDAEQVTSIEVYKLEGFSDHEDYDLLRSGEPVYVIEEEVAAFLNELKEIRFRYYIIIVLAAIDPSFSYDKWTLQINYTDGSYEYLSCAGYGQTYDKNGECIGSHHYGCDREEWEELISKFIPEDIFNQASEID